MRVRTAIVPPGRNPACGFVRVLGATCGAACTANDRHALVNIGIAPGEVRIVPPAFQPQGQSGSVRIAHDCGYGGLAGKAVAIEPPTGFAFDTPLVSRPH